MTVLDTDNIYSRMKGTHKCHLVVSMLFVRTVQVTRQLSALCIQAHQHQAAMGIRQFATASLGLWLYKTTGGLNASPASRLAVGVRHQLQASGLLQHMAAILTDAGDGLTAAAAAAVDFEEPARGSSSSSGGSSTTGSSTAAQDSAEAAGCLGSC